MFCLLDSCQVCTSSVVKDVWNGGSCHVLAFGGSGTGRSFTLFGRRLTSVSDGVIQRIARRLFLLGGALTGSLLACVAAIIVCDCAGVLGGPVDHFEADAQSGAHKHRKFTLDVSCGEIYCETVRYISGWLDCCFCLPCF
jgi:hypothetical protein